MSSTDLESLCSDSVALCQQGKLFDALTLLNNALQLAAHPHHQRAVRGTMAAALNGLGRHDDALMQARLALEIEPRDLVALCAYASAQLSRHDYAACIATCELALQSHPDHPQILYNQGGAFAGLGRNHETLAIVQFENLCEMSHHRVTAKVGRKITDTQAFRNLCVLVSSDR